MICNKDCFHCPYPDCIRGETQDEAERKAEWRKNHPDRVKEIRRNQYIRHRESEKAYQKKHYNKIKDTAEYKESRRIYMNEYRKRMKERVNQ